MRSDAFAVPLVAAALAIVLVSSLVDQRRLHGELKEALTAQAASLEGSRKVEVQLDGLAKGLRQLAQDGNPNAQRIVEMLKQNGVNINDAGSAK